MYKALTTFVGKVSMVKDEVKEISDELIVKDLMKAGYIEEVKKAEVKPKNEVKEETSKNKK